MKSRRNHKQKMRLGLSKDRISTLPSDIIENILIRLSLREAVQTSILSRNWRFKWCSIPELTFDGRSFGHAFCCSNHVSQIQSSIVRSINQVLLLHRGPIHSFVLLKALEDCSDIDRWMLVLSRSGIRKLILCMESRNRHIYKVPSHLFSCDMITFLDLHKCSFVPPDSFKGFDNLKTLILVCCHAPAEKLENLIVNSPHLEELKLTEMVDYISLAVRAPKLRRLTIGRGALNLSLDTPLLDFAFIEISYDTSLRDYLVGNMEVFGLMKVLSSIPNVQKLILESYILKISKIPRQLPFTLMLKKLNMDISFEDGKEVSAALSIIRSCPLLEKLHVSVIYKREPWTYLELWEEQDDLTKVFKFLKKAKLTNFQGIYHDLKFIEFLLANAPFLVIFKIKSEEYEHPIIRTSEHVNRFQRCSPQVQVIY